MKLDSKQTLAPLSIFFHWSIAIAFIAILALGKYMDIAADYSIYPLHKSLGIAILVLVIPRIVWRYKNGLPSALGGTSKQHTVAKVAHIALLVATLLMPISGMLMSGFGGYGLPLFGLELVAANPNPSNPSEMLPINETLATIGHSIHGGAQWAIIVLILVHIAAALKHHIIDKDSTLRRMLGKSL